MSAISSVYIKWDLDLDPYFLPDRPDNFLGETLIAETELEVE
jgi:hypothetical protein